MCLGCSVHHWGASMACMLAGGAQHTLLTAHPARLAQGYPSIGDLHSTVPVPKEKWYEYAGERSGRFQVWPQRGFLPSCCESQNTLSAAEKCRWRMLCSRDLLETLDRCVSRTPKQFFRAELAPQVRVHLSPICGAKRSGRASMRGTLTVTAMLAGAHKCRWISEDRVRHPHRD